MSIDAISAIDSDLSQLAAAQLRLASAEAQAAPSSADPSAVESGHAAVASAEAAVSQAQAALNADQASQTSAVSPTAAPQQDVGAVDPAAAQVGQAGTLAGSHFVDTVA